MDPENQSDITSFISSTSQNRLRSEVSNEDLESYRNRSSVSTVSTIGRSFVHPREVRLKHASGPLTENTLKGIADYILSGNVKNIVVLAGAGISTSAGIPDFRSPETGIYSNLSKYNIGQTEFSFDIELFKRNPAAFYEIFRSYIGVIKSARPTLAHKFFKLLAKKNLLLRVYTQNVDGLEKTVGINPELIVEAHGTLTTARCVQCGAQSEIDDLEAAVMKNTILQCSVCNGLVKSDVILFGEQLPESFFECVEEDCRKCDLLITAGTSLMVYPVSCITQLIPPDVPRLLINNEKVGPFKSGADISPAPSEGSANAEYYRNESTNGNKPGHEEIFDDCTENMDLVMYDRDVCWLGKCDDGFRELINYLGWTSEFEQLSDN